MDGVAVRGEPAVGLVNVRADVARAGDYVRGVGAGLPEVLGAELAPVDACEQALVGVDAPRTELLGHHSVHGITHGVVVRRTHRLDQVLALVPQADGGRPQVGIPRQGHLPAHDVSRLPLGRAPVETEHRAVLGAELRVPEQDRRRERGVDPRSQPHGVGGEHQVLQQQVGLDLRAHRPEGAERQLDVLVQEP